MTESYARVIIDIDAPHLDTDFDYRVPSDLEGAVAVGSLVKVRFRGRLVNAYVVELRTSTDFSGRILPITRVVSPLPVLSPGLIATVTYLANRYCASRSQILSFIMPRRVASVDKQLADRIVRAKENGEGVFASHLSPAPPEHSVRTCLPGAQRSDIFALAQNQVALGHTAIILAPTAAASEAIAEDLSQDDSLRVGHVDSDDGPTRRYRTYLQALLGDFDVLVGTRSAVWTPLPRLGSIIIWDDGDDRYVEQRAPRFGALDVAVARAHVEGLSLASLAFARSVKSQMLVESGWAQEAGPEPALVRSVVPRLRSFDTYAAQREGATGRTLLPDAAFRLLREGLENGPVLVQVPGAGYIVQTDDRTRIGSDRIGEELANAFVGTPVQVSSSSAGIVRDVPGVPAIIVATAGAEPTAEDGYAAVIITGATGLAYSEGMDSLPEAQRRWMGALALAKRAAPALLVGEVPKDLWDSLVLWRPQILASSVLRERFSLGFPPARWVVAIMGAPSSVTTMKQAAEGALGPARFHLPGEPYADLALLGEMELVDEKGEDPALRIIMSVAPRNITVLMESLGDARRALSQRGAALTQVEVNPKTLAPTPR